MKENNLIEIIKNTLNSKYINDDCAYLEDLGIVVTQDSLVEDVHFSLKYTTAFQLGYKSVAVNLSDVYASGARAKYLTCSLSLPNYIDENFIKEFYEGAKSVNSEVEIVGGDVTGSDKLFISICAIGETKNRKISSRSSAKEGYKIITNGVHGSSGCGFELLQRGSTSPQVLVDAHLMPKVNDILSNEIALNIKENYAMMDSSDGLMDALYKISKLSNLTAEVDFNKIPIDEEIKEFEDYKNKIFFGAEDYKLIACVPEEILKTLDKNLYTEIGFMTKKQEDVFVKVRFADEVRSFTENDVEEKTFKHFD